MTTASGGVIIERKYTGRDAHVRREARVVADLEYAGVSDPVLAEPADFDSEIAERRETHRPMKPVETDLRNTLFGI